jgi:hypothetical protein
MLTNRNLSHINSLKDLKAAKLLAESDIDEAEKRLEYLFSDLPMQALGSTVGFVAGAVAKGFQNHSKSEKNPEVLSAENDKQMSFGQTLQSVGEETALFALSKLIEKLVGNR